MHTALADNKCAWQVTFPLCESFRADCCSPKGPISVLKWQLPPKGESIWHFLSVEGKKKSLECRFKFSFLLIPHDATSNLRSPTLWLVPLGSCHPGWTCFLVWFRPCYDQYTAKHCIPLWSVTAGICFHSNTAALVMSGADAGLSRRSCCIETGSGLCADRIHFFFPLHWNLETSLFFRLHCSLWLTGAASGVCVLS